MPRKTPEQVVSKGRKALIIYAFLTFPFISALVQLLTEGKALSAVIALLFILLFLWKGKQGFQAMGAGRSFKNYMHQLSLTKDNSLASLSHALSLPEHQVKKSLLAMEKNGLLESVVFSPDGIIHIKGADQFSFKLKSAEEKMGEILTIKCPSCGADVHMREGTGKKCDYCRTMVSAPKK